jgi:hypothetical protein
MEPTSTMEPTRAWDAAPGEQGPGTGPSGPYGSQGPGTGFGSYAPQGPPGPPSGGYQPMYGSGPTPPAPPTRSGPSPALIIGLVALAVLVVVGLVVFLSSDDDENPTATDGTTTTAGSSDTTGSDTTGDTSSDTTADSETTDVFAIGVGDCLTDETSVEGEVSDVQTVPCDQPHAQEVYHSYTIDTDELPGEADMEGIVETECLGAFETFVGLPYPDSIYDITWLAPTQESWDAGDRELLCLVFDPSGDVTGSLSGARQ